MLKRERIGICTLCAPYASRRHGSRTRMGARKYLEKKEKIWSRRADSNR